MSGPDEVPASIRAAVLRRMKISKSENPPREISSVPMGSWNRS
ncbi:hypothetical protein ABT383_18065 [Streptomyces humidus]|nr:hypothetical protein [Streptomyces humidus]